MIFDTVFFLCRNRSQLRTPISGLPSGMTPLLSSSTIPVQYNVQVQVCLFSLDTWYVHTRNNRKHRNNRAKGEQQKHRYGTLFGFAFCYSLTRSISTVSPVSFRLTVRMVFRCVTSDASTQTSLSSSTQISSPAGICSACISREETDRERLLGGPLGGRGTFSGMVLFSDSPQA